MKTYKISKDGKTLYMKGGSRDFEAEKTAYLFESNKITKPKFLSDCAEHYFSDHYPNSFYYLYKINGFGNHIIIKFMDEEGNIVKLIWPRGKTEEAWWDDE